jgi:hypothetical protein
MIIIKINLILLCLYILSKKKKILLCLYIEYILVLNIYYDYVCIYGIIYYVKILIECLIIE